jgi:hypothetical protein
MSEEATSIAVEQGNSGGRWSPKRVTDVVDVLYSEQETKTNLGITISLSQASTVVLSQDLTSPQDPTLLQEYDIGKCCFCGDECNPCSQVCGPCMRGYYLGK